MLVNIPKEVEEYIIPPEENCSECGAELKVIGKSLYAQKWNLFRQN
nr:hypothetical protein [Acetivibrio cellulolyticus]